MSLVTVTRDSPQHKGLRYAALAALVIVAVLLPWFLEVYRLGQFTFVIVFAIATLGLNLLVGYAGQISLGHGAFYALGAYTCAVAITKGGLPWPVAIVLAAIVSGIAGILLGIPALRLRGLYLALVTLAVAVAMPQLIKKFGTLTGGTQGLQVDLPPSPGFLAQDQWIYYISLITAAILFFLASKMVSGRVGRALIAIRDNEIAATTQGVNLATFKVGAFAISSAYAGVAGALFVFAIGGFVAPEAFTLVVSFSFLAAIVVGGLATIWGAVFGALFLEFVPVWAQNIQPEFTNVIYGGVLILFMYALPHGAMGLLRKIGGKVVDVRPMEVAPAGAHGGRPLGADPEEGAGRPTDDSGSPTSGMRPAKS